MNKNHITILMLVLSCFSYAAEVTVYDGNQGTGNYLSIYGESIYVDHYAINYGLNYNLGDRISSVYTSTGYCTILAEHPFFNGDWGEMRNGLNNVGDQYFSRLNNKTSSLAVYKKIREGTNNCSAHTDIPILYENNFFSGRRYPLIDNNRINALGREVYEVTASGCTTTTNSGLNIAGSLSTFNSSTGTWNDPWLSINYQEGASVSTSCASYADLKPRDLQKKASSLRVPECYKVLLYKPVEIDIFPYGTLTQLQVKEYGPGEYNFSDDGSNDSYWYFESRRQAYCTQPAFVSPPPATGPPATSCGAPSEAYCH